MFRFRKKEAKPSPENDWHELMVTFFSDSVIDLTNTVEKEYWLTYGLGYLSAYLKSVKAKGKIVEQVECQMLEEFGNYSKEEAGFLRKRIERSTSNQSPLYQELIFKGLEVFSESADEQSKALMVKKTEISELLAAEVDGKEKA